MKLAAILAVLLLASAAAAQEPCPADVQIFRDGSVYTVRVQAPSDADMAQICLDRVDSNPVTPLGCVPAGADETVVMTATVAKTTWDDAELRAYAVDTSDLVSDYSCNAGIIDFTPPGRPHVK